MLITRYNADSLAWEVHDTDDFPTDVPDELCIKSFIEQLEEEFL